MLDCKYIFLPGFFKTQFFFCCGVENDEELRVVITFCFFWLHL